MIYEQGIKEYVPFYKVKEKKKVQNVKGRKREEMKYGGE